MAGPVSGPLCHSSRLTPAGQLSRWATLPAFALPMHPDGHCPFGDSSPRHTPRYGRPLEAVRLRRALHRRRQRHLLLTDRLGGGRLPAPTTTTTFMAAAAGPGYPTPAVRRDAERPELAGVSRPTPVAPPLSWKGQPHKGSPRGPALAGLVDRNIQGLPVTAPRTARPRDGPWWHRRCQAPQPRPTTPRGAVRAGQRFSPPPMTNGHQRTTTGCQPNQAPAATCHQEAADLDRTTRRASRPVVE